MTVADVDRDFYRLLGSFAEEAQFVHRTVTGEGIVYDVVIGSVYARHTHRLRFRLRGERIRHVASAYRGLGKSERS